MDSEEDVNILTCGAGLDRLPNLRRGLVSYRTKLYR